MQGSNPHDDKLVLNKHATVYPTDAEVSAYYIEYFIVVIFKA